MKKVYDELIQSEELILLRRAEELAQVIDTDKHQKIKGDEYLIFNVNDIKYGIQKNFVQELHLNISPIAVPCTPNYIKGIVNIRGEIVSVTDLVSFFGISSIKEKAFYQAIRVKGNNELEFNIIADEIDTMAEFESSDISPFPVSTDSRLEKYCKGVTNERIYILDLEKILSDEKIIVDEG